MKRGYLPLYRKIQDHPFYKEKRVFSKYEAWVDILMEVRQNLEPKEVLFGMTVVVCCHGQSLYSLRTWGSRWGWSGKKVSRFFILLEKLNQIKSENVTVTTRITVLNYKIYDVKCHTDVTQGKHDRNSSDTQLSHDCPTNNNVKKDIPDSDESGPQEFYTTKKKRKLTGKRLETFNLFWNAFGFMKGKADAADSWYDIPQLTESLVSAICDAAKIEAVNRIKITESGGTPKWAQGWLTSRRWEDEDLIVGEKPKEKTYVI